MSRTHPLELEVCESSVRRRFRLHPRIAKSEASILFELTIDSARKLVVEPPATVGLGLCSGAIPDVSYDLLFMRWSSAR